MPPNAICSLASRGFTTKHHIIVVVLFKNLGLKRVPQPSTLLLFHCEFIMTQNNIYCNDSPYYSRTIVQKSVNTHELGYESFGDVSRPPSLVGGGGDGEVFHTRQIQGRRGSVTKYSFEIQEASLAVAVDELVLNSHTYRDEQCPPGTALPSCILGTRFSSERSSKEVPTQTTYTNGH